MFNLRRVCLDDETVRVNVNTLKPRLSNHLHGNNNTAGRRESSQHWSNMFIRAPSPSRCVDYPSVLTLALYPVSLPPTVTSSRDPNCPTEHVVDIQRSLCSRRPRISLSLSLSGQSVAQQSYAACHSLSVSTRFPVLSPLFCR